MMTPISASTRKTVDGLMMWDATSRTIGMFTTESGTSTGASSPSMRPLSPRLTVWPNGCDARTVRAPGPAARPRHPPVVRPDASRRMSARTASAFGVDRYSSLTLASVPGADDLELGHAEQARDHRPREVDPLHAVERRAALRAEQDAAAHLDVVAGDAERVEPPRHVEDRDEHEQDAEHRQHRDDVQVVGDDEVDRIAGALPLLELLGRDVGRERRNEQVEQSIAQVRDDDARR